MSYTIASVDRAIDLLETLAEHPGVGVTRLADLMGSTKSHVFRLLHTLERRGYVLKDPEMRTFRLGYRALFLGDHARDQSSLPETAGPIMDGLSQATGENVHLIVRDGAKSVCIALRQSQAYLRLYAEVGRHGPLHAGGGSLLLLAYAPDDIRDTVLGGELTGYTERTITEPSLLREELARVRRQGYHVALEDLDEGAFSIATPIRDHRGDVVAAISVAGPITRLDDATRDRHLRLANTAAEDISRRLGRVDRELA